jgi:large subunit ribosomal protein L24
MATNLKKDDLVVVLTGKDKGKQGRVLRVLRSKDTLLVEGVNIVKKHKKPDQRNQSGGIVEQEAPLGVQKVMLVDPKSGKPTRTVRKHVEGKKQSVRVSVKTRAVID